MEGLAATVGVVDLTRLGIGVSSRASDHLPNA
jgi:hypothetical protein